MACGFVAKGQAAREGSFGQGASADAPNSTIKKSPQRKHGAQGMTTTDPLGDFVSKVRSVEH
jgi:hypothetical protein